MAQGGPRPSNQAKGKGAQMGQAKGVGQMGHMRHMRQSPKDKGHHRFLGFVHPFLKAILKLIFFIFWRHLPTSKFKSSKSTALES